jgi:hypothetical protein
MKTFCVMTMIVLLMLCANVSQAQTTQPKLNQVELMKLFIGNWKIQWTKDTVYYWDLKAFETGLESYFKTVVKDKIISEGKQIWGYDSKLDKYVGASLEKGKDIMILAMWYTSNNRYILTFLSDINNLDKPYLKAEGVVKPDAISETYYINGKYAYIWNYQRIK